MNENGSNDGVVYATPYCDSEDPFWNTTFSWRTDHPDFTPCFQMTLLATVPCAFILLSFPFHLAHLCKKNRGRIAPSSLHMAKCFTICFMLLLTLIDLGWTVWLEVQNYGQYAPVYIVTPVLLHVSLCLAGWLIYYERVRGCQSSGVLWIFWFLLALVLAVPLRSYIHLVSPLSIDQRASKIKAILFFVFYSLTVVQFLCHCFAEPPPAPRESSASNDKEEEEEDNGDDEKNKMTKRLPCPEESSSFLSRITFNWFFRLAWRGFRQPLTQADVWQLDDYDKASHIDEVFRSKWSRFGHYREVQEKDRIRAEKEKEKNQAPDLEVKAFLNNDEKEPPASSNQDKEAELTRVRLTKESSDEEDDFTVEIKNGKANANVNHDQNVNDNAGKKKEPSSSWKNKLRKKDNKKSKKDEAKEDGKKPSLWSLNRGGKRYLLNTLIRAFGKTFLVAMIFKLIHDLLVFVPPYFLKLLIYYIRATHGIGSAQNATSGLNDTSNPESYVGRETWKGYFFAVLLFVACILQTTVLHQYFHRCILTGIWLRTALISAIYRKSLNLSSSARSTTTTGEIVNLMSVDAQKFMEICTYVNMLWSAPLQIIIGIWMLWGILGPSTLAGICVMILLMPVNGCLANRYKVYQVAQMKLKDERIKMVNEVLNGMKVLKLYGWEPSFLKKMSDIRKREVVFIRKMAILNAVSSLLWTCAPNFVSLATFYTFVLSDSNNVLDAEKTFVSMAYFNILRFPMSVLPMMISSLVQTYVSLKRINNFLRLEELDTQNVTPSDASSPNALEISSDASFQWSPDDPVVLDHLEVKVKRGALVAVVGPVGSGKSSLISAFLGNLHKKSGRVTRDPSVAFVPQQPWIQNATLESNILFHSSMDDEWYERVVWACAMEPDLAMLPDGDQTEIGEKGINLSGGQKQRVSLARAVYSKREVYLLDDPLSAVDSHVGKHLFDQVIGPTGLLATKTRLLVTHSISFLDQVDYIYVVNDGVITAHGTYGYLMAVDSKFTEFINLHSVKAKEEEDLDETEKALSQLQMDLLTPRPSRPSGDTTRAILTSRRSHSRSRSLSKSASLVALEKKDVDEDHEDGDVFKAAKKEVKERQKLIQEENAEVGNVKMSVIRVYVRAVGICLAVLGVSLFFIQQAFDIGINIWLENWSNQHEMQKSGKSKDAGMSLQHRLLVYAAMTVSMGFIVVCGSFAIAMGNIRASMKLHDGLAENILRSPMSFFDTVPVGRILNRFSKDIDTVDSTIPYTIRGFLGTLVRVLGTIFIVSYGTPLFLTVCPFLFIIYFLAQRFYIPASRQLKRLESTTRSPIYSLFSESIAGVSTIKAYDRQGDFVARIFRLVDENVACYFPNMVSNRWLAIRLEFVGNCIMFFAALFAIINAEKLEPGTIGLTLSAAMQITQTLNWMVRMTSELENNIVSVERIQEYTETPVEAPWRIEATQPASEWPAKADVIFDQIDLRYRDGLELVLKGVSVDIKDGEKVGIVGRTGAGKSSLTLALFRLVELAGGKIEIDGIDSSSIGLHDLRTKISIIPQDPVLFSGTLRMNLDPFETYSDEAIWEALEHAHLKDYVKDLADGLQHQCSEGGENLSVGQRQLVCLARALLRNSNILVLDEATAAVDLETDLLIQGTIRSQFASSTILTIAHRLNTVMDYDKILVMSAGQVAQYDTPQNLLKDQSGIFYSMAKDANLA